MTPSSHPLTEAGLEQFVGTEHYYQSSLGIKYTDGIQYLADRAQTFWRIDAIAHPQNNTASHQFGFLRMKLLKNSRRESGIKRCSSVRPSKF